MEPRASLSRRVVSLLLRVFAAMIALTRAGVVLSAFAVTAALLSSAEAHAGPDCEVGRRARASVFDQDFGRNLAVAVAPFAVIAALSGAVYRLGRSDER